jgi:hypothetical protein
MKAKQKITKKLTESMSQEAVLQTERDFKDALLVVSMTANLFMVSLWVALQVTSRYDTSLMSFFLHR